MKTEFLKTNYENFINFLNTKNNTLSQVLKNKTLKAWITKGSLCDGDAISLIASRDNVKANKYSFNDVFGLVKECAKYYEKQISNEKTSVNDLKVGKEYKRPDIWVKVNNFNSGAGMFFSNLGKYEPNEYLICMDHKDNAYGYISFSDDETYTYDCQKIKGIVNEKFVSWIEDSANDLHKKILLFVQTNNSKFIFRGYQKWIKTNRFNDDSGQHVSFVFKPENSNDINILLKLSDEKNKEEMQKNSSLSDEQLKKKAEKISKCNSKNQKPPRIVYVKQYYRNQTISDHVIRKAKGVCCLCGKSVGINLTENVPELQCHHKIPLSRGGQDIIENCEAVCPNCHRHLHKFVLKKE